MSEPRLCEGTTYRLPQRFHIDLSGIGLEINLFDLVVSTTPGIRLVRNRRSLNLVDEAPPVILCPTMTMCGCDLPSVIAMIAVHFVAEIPDFSVDEPHPFRDVGIDVPTEQHLLVKAVVLNQVRALEKLEVARTVVANNIAAENDLIEVQIPSPVPDGVDDFSGPLTVQTFPQRFRKFDPWRVIESLWQVSDNISQGANALKNEYHVGISRQDPTIRWPRAPHGNIPRDRLKREQRSF